MKEIKNQIIRAMEVEVNVIKHLYSKLPQDSLNFRPAENMRSTAELLDYLTWIGGYMVEGFVSAEEKPDLGKIMRSYQERARKFSPSQFTDAMDEQMQDIKQNLQDFEDNELTTKDVLLPWGATMKMGDALLNSVLKYFTAYKMQLFLYAKMSGASQLNTVNCWMGMDPR